MWKFLGNIIQLIISPASGWEDIAADDRRTDGRRGLTDIRKVYLGSFLPLIAVCAATYFLRMLYTGGPDFLQALQQTIIQFFSLFLSYHIAIYVFSLALPRLMSIDEQPDPRRSALLIMHCISVIALVFLLGNLIKVNVALIQFLPIYVIFIIWKGATYMGVPDRNLGLYMIMASATILGAVYGLSLLFNVLL